MLQEILEGFWRSMASTGLQKGSVMHTQPNSGALCRMLCGQGDREGLLYCLGSCIDLHSPFSCFLAMPDTCYKVQSRSLLVE